MWRGSDWEIKHKYGCLLAHNWQGCQGQGCLDQTQKLGSNFIKNNQRPWDCPYMRKEKTKPNTI